MEYLRRCTDPIRRWLDEARSDKDDPWFVKDPPRPNRRDSVLAYGAFRRACARRRATFLVIRQWWRSRYEPEIPTNGAALVSYALGGSMKPVLWIGSVIIAGIVGLEFASTRSKASFDLQVNFWLGIALVVFGIAVIIQLSKAVDRLRRATLAWRQRCAAMTPEEMNSEDRRLIGYSLGVGFRRSIKTRGVFFYLTATVCLLVLPLVYQDRYSTSDI